MSVVAWPSPGYGTTSVRSGGHPLVPSFYAEQSAAASVLYVLFFRDSKASTASVVSPSVHAQA